MSTTPHLSLNVYEAADNPLVKTWRDDLSLNSAGSSLVKIDTWAGQTETRLGDLEESRKTFRIIATSAVQDNYTATSAELVSLVAGIQLQFSADQVNIGGSTLNINSLGSKTIRKINNLGTTVDLELNDIIPNRMYTFEYDGTIWILRSGFTGSQIVINGTVGNIISIDAENNPADSNIAIVGGKITSAGIALGSGIVDDGTGNIMLSDTGVAAGTYVGLTVDGKGRITEVATPNPSPTGNEILISTDGALSWDAQAPDSAKLGGQLPAYYLSTTAKAADSDKLNGQLASYYLTTTGKAADADKLDNLDSADFWKKTDNVTADKVDDAHASATPAAATIPIADAGGKLAVGWLPLWPNRNIIINGGFTINQRGRLSGTALAVGVYGHDRWKGGSAQYAGDYTFTQLASPTVITFVDANRSLIQVIEDKNVYGGTYILSWIGTAQGRYAVNSATPAGAYAASPIVITGQNPGTVMSVEFKGGTLGEVQLELGTVKTAFEFRPFQQELALCQRYCPFWTLAGDKLLCNAMATGSSALFGILKLPVTSRVVPTGARMTGGWAAITPAFGVTGSGSFSYAPYSNTEYLGLTLNAISGEGLVAGNATFIYTGGGGTIEATGCEL